MNCLTQRRNLQQHFCDSQLWIRQIGHHMLSWNHEGSIKRQPWESCTTAEQVVQHKFGTARNRQPMEKAASPKNSICQHRGIRETSPLNTPSPIDPGHGGATVGEFFHPEMPPKENTCAQKEASFGVRPARLQWLTYFAGKPTLAYLICLKSHIFLATTMIETFSARPLRLRCPSHKNLPVKHQKLLGSTKEVIQTGLKPLNA